MPRPKPLDIDALLAQARANGLTFTETACRPFEAPAPVEAKPRLKKPLLPSCFVPPATFLVGIRLESEANLSGHWTKKNRRKRGCHRAVSELLGKHLAILVPFAEHYHAGGAVKVKMIRLGGNKLDTGNLWNAVKGLEDAIAFMIGANDGDPRWVAEPGQETGGDRVGVKVQLENV